MPLGVQARCGTSRTILGALTATAAALRAGVEAAMPSGFVHHGRVSAVQDGDSGSQRAGSQAP